MDNTKTLQNVDRRNLSVDQVAELDAHLARQRQLDSLGTIASGIDQLKELFSSTSKDDVQGIKAVSDILGEIRQGIVALQNKKDPDPIDFTEVVRAIKHLESKVNVTPEFKPEFNPDIHVEASAVDLKGVEQLLKTDLPKAFNKAIESIPKTEIPKTDYTPLVDQLKDMSKQLESIDTASRLKPQFPGIMKVTNGDGSDVRSPSIFREYNDIEMTNADGNGNYQTMTLKSGSTTVYTLSLTYDGSNNVTSIVRS